MNLPPLHPDVMVMPKKLATEISRTLGRASPVIHWLYINKQMIALFILR